MKSLLFLATCLSGFCYLTYQFSFWFAIGTTYITGMALVALIAFITKKSAKVSMG